MYRTGGEVVRIYYDTVIEKDPRPFTPGVLPMKLSMEQLLRIANTPELTIG